MKTIEINDAKMLRWYEIQGVRRLCIKSAVNGCDAVFASPFGSTYCTSTFRQGEAIELPEECDSWDWQPKPEPETDPGYGWRLLKPEESTICGDECRVPHGTDADWRKSGNFIHGNAQQSRGLQYRRRIEPGEGWRFVDITREQLEKSDQVLSRRTREWVCCDAASMFSINNIYRRKIEQPTPAQEYRPFANAAEFAPYANRTATGSEGCEFVLVIRFDSNTIYYIERGGGVVRTTYREAFGRLLFDDGTPFGLEVTS